DERSNRLARHLRRHGVGPEVPVIVFAERSAEIVVMMLGILKAGGAYVPVDPTYPRERLAYILEDAHAPVILTEQKLAGVLPPHAARVIDVSAAQDIAEIERIPEHRAQP